MSVYAEARKVTTHTLQEMNVQVRKSPCSPHMITRLLDWSTRLV